MGEKDLAEALYKKKRFCTMKNAYKLQQGGKYVKLQTLYSTFYKENLGDAHDARVDVLMCKKLYEMYELVGKIHKE
jgi:hypothetical protein